MTRARRVVICGGGTGGHTFPALAVGRELRRALPSVNLTFIGSGRPVEREIMTRAGEAFHPLGVAGLRGRGWKIFPALLRLPAALLETLNLLWKLKPDLVVGVGGYSSGPFVLLAAVLGKPAVILEQNVRPGLTNRLLLPWVKRAVASFERTLPFLRGKGVFLGNPVRPEFASLKPRPRDGKLSLLVAGGSQGSRFLNETMTAALPALGSRKGELNLVHQTGAADQARVVEAYRRSGFDRADIRAFIVDMPAAMGAADLVIGRAGATTVAELIAAGKPSLLVPFARAAGGHQLENALELERAGGAEVWPEATLTPAKLAERILDFAGHPRRLEEMAAALKSLRTDDAAGRIAGLCLEIMGVEPRREAW